MKQTIKELHQAAQYLAAAGINFIEKKGDDSHTNVGWNKDLERLETHYFEGDFQLGLNLSTANLVWIKGGVVTSSCDLRTNTHGEIIIWVKTELKKNKLSNEYTYEFHYELPYPARADNDRFSLNGDALNEISERFNIGQQVFEQFLKDNNLDSPIRIWPHHFDLGIYASLNSDATTFLGAGLAIPDTLENDLYYYAAAYHNGTDVVTKAFSGLTVGKWRSDWNGATLSSKEININNALNFLNEVKKGFLDNV